MGSCSLRDESRGSGSSVFPSGREGLDGLVVTSESVNARLNINESVLGAEVLAIALKVLADIDSLLDEVVHVLRDLGGETVSLENAEDLGASDIANLANTVGITKNDTNLGRSQALLGELGNVLIDLLGGDLQPRGRSALIRDGACRNTLSTTIHATHLE